jgi:hypothetical protein
MFPLLIFSVQTAFACSLQRMELRQASPDLTVVVTHRGRPIAGIEVQVVPEKSTETVFTGTTNNPAMSTVPRSSAAERLTLRGRSST